MLSASDYYIYEPPRIDGNRVNGCTLEFGSDNCSKWGKEQAANAFCRKKGHRKAKRWSWRHYGDRGIRTLRYKIYRKDGHDRRRWEYCSPCSIVQTKVKCLH